MTIVASYDWESDTWTHNSDNPTRTAWREAVAEIAEKAKATLPECNGRVDKAVAIVLAGDVEIMPDGKTKVASQSNGTPEYFVVNGTCECKDYSKAPSGWCKHRIAAGLAKRAYPLAKAKLDTAIAPQNGHTEHQPAPAQPQAEVVPTLPEAPASVNCHIMLEGRQAQVTLRDTDESRLLARLATLLRQYPVAQPPTQGMGCPVPDDSPYCPKHKVPMKQQHKDGRTWYSHWVADAKRWCKGK